nr:AAA family ATPase [Corynebacterium sp. ACRPE]
MPLLLSGEPGTGKTTLAVAAFGEELITISCHEGMRREDLVGQWMPIQDKPGEFEWKDGPLVEAMLTGKPVLVDDFGWASPEVQAALLPVADHRRTISVIDRPEQSDIDAVDGFSLVLTHNPNMGVGIIDPIMDRMAFEVEVPTDLETADKLGVDPTLLQIAYQLEDEAKHAESEGSSGWVPSIRTLLETTRIQQVFGTEFAASAFLAACPIDQLEYRQRLHRMIQAQMGKDARVSDGLRSVASD